MKTGYRVLAALAVMAMAASAQNLALWPKYKNITVNTQAGGADVSADVTNFPVLVRLSAANANDIFTEALAGGADIRFGKADGTPLPYEIEHWDATAKLAAIWVLADTVKGNSNSASMRIYWGRTGVASASNGAAVFDTANDYVAVWHMNGTTTETSSTVHTSEATPFNAPGSAAAAIGAGRTFDGTQHLQVVGSAGGPMNFLADTTYTFSAWIRNDSVVPTGDNTGHAILTKGDFQWALAVFGNPPPNRWYEITTHAGEWQWHQTTTNATAEPAYAGQYANDNVGVWRHVVGTWDGSPLNASTGRIYLDGVLQKESVFNVTTTTTQVQTARDVHIGVLSNLGAGNTDATGQLERYFIGALDEITVSANVRSPDWVKLSYETQKPAATAVALGSTQTQEVVADTVKNIRYVMPGTGNSPRDTLVFELNQPVNLPLQYDGGPIDSVKITGFNTSFPAGLSIDLTSGLLSGTPTEMFAAANRTLTVYTSLGNVTRGLRVSVGPGPLAGFEYAQDTAEYVVGSPINANSASWSPLGRAPTGFSVNPALPAGLTVNATNGAISGTPTAIAAAANYTVTAFNATDTVTTVIRLSVINVANENYTGNDWPNKRVVYLNTQSNGANVTGGVSNFPVLVRLDTSNFNVGFTQAQLNGADIRFTKINNTTRLPHQIERWDANGKRAEIWVRLDSIPGAAIDSIRMHWGNATAPNLSSGPAVFDTLAGFQAVWHMNAASGNEQDATPNGFGATATNDPGTAAGVVGPARTFNGTDQFFVAAGTASGKLNFSQADSYTLSSWINPTAISEDANTGHKIIDKGDNQYVLATYGSAPDDRYWEITIRGNDTWNQCQSNGSFAGSTAILASSSVGAWHHLVGTYAGGEVGSPVTQRLYFNGVLVNECPISNESTAGRNLNHNVHIGVQSGTAPSGNFTRHWNGLLDEVRLASRARSAHWVKLEFENQKAAQTLVTFTRPDTVVSVGSAASMAMNGVSLDSRNVAGGVQFRLQGVEAARATLSLVDVWGRTVWTGNFVNGALSWDGRVTGGANAATGIYLARVNVRDAQGKTIAVLDRRLPYTR